MFAKSTERKLMLVRLTQFLAAAAVRDTQNANVWKSPTPRRLQSEECENVDFTRRIISGSVAGADDVYAADLDGDGLIDVISTARGEDKIYWHKNDGSSPPMFTHFEVTTLARDSTDVIAADLDGDDHLDIISAEIDGDTVAWYQNTGESPPAFNRRTLDTELREPYGVYAADLDGDGDIDVIAAFCDSDRIEWYENDGGNPPVFSGNTIPTSVNCASGVYAADVDGDGNIDILSASQTDDEINLFVNNGEKPPTFTRVEISDREANGAFSIYAVDLDNDGKLDILSASLFDGEVAWYANDGEFTRRIIESELDRPRAVYAADLNNDGAIDVLSASSDDGTIAWYQNDGRGAPSFFPGFARKNIDTSATGARSVFAVDLDGDGDIDVLAAAFGSNTVYWYENLCIGGPGESTAPTYRPTDQPVSTYQPTDQPEPTYRPTDQPVSTYQPTDPPDPTARPTDPPEPTIRPSDTSKPSLRPTDTSEPSLRPTDTPQPTARPTDTPEPSARPTDTPEPSIRPTDSPDPSIRPTDTPDPSMRPTDSPDPSMRPTDTPEPSLRPTDTSEPSLRPTDTSEPSMRPHDTPEPSVRPTDTPQPTAQPKSKKKGEKPSVMVYLVVTVAITFAFGCTCQVIVRCDMRRRPDKHACPVPVHYCMSCDACFSDLNYEQYRAEHYRHDDVGSSDAGVEMRYENKAPEDEDDENEIAIDDGDRVQHYGVFGLGDGGLQHEHGNNEILLVVAEDDREILQHVQDLFSEMKGCDNRANRRKFFKCLRRHPSLRDFFGLPQNSQEGPWREIFEFIANTDNQSRDKFTEDRWIVRTREFQEKQRIGP